MKIAVDCDGPLYEWDKTARYMLRTMRGCTGLSTPSREWLLPNQDWHSVTDEDWEWLWTEGVRLGLFRHGHLTTGAMVGIRDLRDAGHELVLVTHRPKEALRDTNAWLELHFGNEYPYPWAGQHILSNLENKAQVDADVLIDDKPENIIDWQNAGREAILFDREWNRNFAEATWIATGWQPVTYIVDLIASHQGVLSGHE